MVSKHLLKINVAVCTGSDDLNKKYFNEIHNFMKIILFEIVRDLLWVISFINVSQNSL